MSANAWTLGTTGNATLMNGTSWSSVCYGNGRFVAVASSGPEHVMVSPNGGYWDPSGPYQVSGATSGFQDAYPPESSWSSVCYGTPTINGTATQMYVAVSSDIKTNVNTGSIMTSTDGLAWTAINAPVNTGGGWSSVCYGTPTINSIVTTKYVAVSSVGKDKVTTGSIMTSTDGLAWTAVSAPVDNMGGWSSVCYGNGYYVAVGKPDINTYRRRFMRSVTGGISWEFANEGQSDFSYNSVCYGTPTSALTPTFVAVGPNVTAYSTDNGSNWTATSDTNIWVSVCYGDGKFVAVSNDTSGKTVATSTNGINWTKIYTAKYSAWTSVCFGNIHYVAVAKSGTMINTYFTERAMHTTNVLIDTAIAQTAWNEASLTDNVNNLTNEAYCYLIGTKILCLIDNTETYIPIENIRNGTLVKTYKRGYIPVKLIGKRNMMNNPKAPQNCLFKMKETGLSITGGHSILVDDLNDYLPFIFDFYAENHRIEDKYILLAGDSDLFEPFMDTNEYTLYHLCLESDSMNDHFGIWADGVLSESTSEKDYFDGLFENTG